MEERYREPRKRKKKKNAGRVIGRIFLSLTLMAILAVAVLAVIYMTDPRRKLTGSWKSETDVTAEVTEHASGYLKAAAMGGQVDVSQYIGDIEVAGILTFKKDGTYSLEIDNDSFGQSREKAYEQMAEAFKELIRVRFEAAGKSADSDSIENLMQASVGMSVKEYLMEFGPDIMPKLSDLEAAYNRSGIYSADRQFITIDNDKIVEYMVSSKMLALDGGSADAAEGETDPLSGSRIYSKATGADRSSETGDDAVNSNVTDVSLLSEDLLADVLDMNKVSAANVKNRMLENLSVHVEGKDSKQVKSIHYEYANNRYVSLRDMALALKGTDAQYGVSISGSEISITKGQAYSSAGGEESLFDVKDIDWNAEPETSSDSVSDTEQAVNAEDTAADDAESEADTPAVDSAEANGIHEYVTESLKFNKISVNGREVKYSTFTGRNSAGNSDAYISITDLAMILDTYMSLEEDVLHVEPGRPFFVDIEALKDAGFYSEVRSALVGDATTGEVYASYCDDVAVSIASTTKLMNLLCVMDAISSGEISRSDTVAASLKASLLSKTDDGVVPMEEGDVFTVEELIYGMMLPSSNECSLLLAEHIAGTEKAYVDRMNAKAAEIGLSEATKFYNCHGLPIYSADIVTTKLQNQMSAADMFALSSYLLAVYPQITDITSTGEYKIVSKDQTIKNLNPMLMNLPEAVGLKTGTTNMAGASLVAAVKATDAAGSEHIIVSVEYGAENAVTRNTMSELMLRYGMSILSGKNQGDSGTGDRGTLPDGANIPVTAEGLIRLLLAA